MLGGGICKEGIALDSDTAAKCDGPDGAGAKEIWKQFTLKRVLSLISIRRAVCAELKRQKHVPLNILYFLVILSFLLVNFHPVFYVRNEVFTTKANCAYRRTVLNSMSNGSAIALLALISRNLFV